MRLPRVRLSVTVLLIMGFVLAGAIAGWRYYIVLQERVATDALRPLEAAEKLTLYSLDFHPDRFPPGAPMFHANAILGMVDISAAQARRPILDALWTGIARCKINEGASCFYPRHGLRAERTGRVEDYLICFECDQIQRYDDKGIRVGDYLTSREPQRVLDARLTAAGVPLAPR